MIRKVFVTTSVYALSHQVGMTKALEIVGKQAEVAQLPTPPIDPPTPPIPWLPCVKTIARICRFAEAVLHVDGGATYIGQARSRAFHEAFKSGLPWITIDDDIEVTTATVGGMLEALDDVAPRIIMTPYPLRGGERTMGRLACDIPSVRVERFVGGNIKLLTLPFGQGGGLGFVGMNRSAMVAIAEACPQELAWVDEDGAQKRALFYERVEDMLWFGEDVSFFRWRVPASVTVELLLAGAVKHAEVPPLDLTKL